MSEKTFTEHAASCLGWRIETIGDQQFRSNDESECNCHVGAIAEKDDQLRRNQEALKAQGSIINGLRDRLAECQTELETLQARSESFALGSLNELAEKDREIQRQSITVLEALSAVSKLKADNERLRHICRRFEPVLKWLESLGDDTVGCDLSKQLRPMFTEAIGEKEAK